MIKCNTCQREYKTLADENPEHAAECTNQAYGCAATLYFKNNEYRIAGSYGSGECDGEVLKFILPKPDFIMPGHICDKCIHILKNIGYIDFDTNYDLFTGEGC